MRRLVGPLVIFFFLAALLGCEYVRPTLNAPLKQWDPQYGYRYQRLITAIHPNFNG